MPSKPTRTEINRRIKKANRIKPKREPAWGGPTEEGVTQSILSGYICCGERARVRLIEGLHSTDEFVPAREYGSLWHEAEEELAATGRFTGKGVKAKAQELAKRYKMQQEAVNKWYHVCMIHFPIYVDYWKTHPDVKDRTPVYQEETFGVGYKLPSGRVVILRGKWDGVDLINSKLFVQENKSKSRMDEATLRQQMEFDLQSMTYLAALRVRLKGKMVAGGVNYGSPKPTPIGGVRYNVIRRPLSGGKGSIRPHKATKSKPAETMEHYYGRLRDVLLEDQDYWFARWKVEVTDRDIDRFERECLQPLLENLCDDYEWWCACLKGSWCPFDYTTRAAKFPRHTRRHYRLPYGVYNTILEGGTGELDHYLATGSTLGLERRTEFFPELD